MNEVLKHLCPDVEFEPHKELQNVVRYLDVVLLVAEVLQSPDRSPFVFRHEVELSDDYRPADVLLGDYHNTLELLDTFIDEVYDLVPDFPGLKLLWDGQVLPVEVHIGDLSDVPPEERTLLFEVHLHVLVLGFLNVEYVYHLVVRSVQNASDVVRLQHQSVRRAIPVSNINAVRYRDCLLLSPILEIHWLGHRCRLCDLGEDTPLLLLLLKIFLVLSHGPVWTEDF